MGLMASLISNNLFSFRCVKNISNPTLIAVSLVTVTTGIFIVIAASRVLPSGVNVVGGVLIAGGISPLFFIKKSKKKSKERAICDKLSALAKEHSTEQWTHHLPEIFKVVSIAQRWQEQSEGKDLTARFDFSFEKSGLTFNAKIVGTHIVITALFGECIGKGSSKSIHKTLDLLKGEFTTSRENGVIAISHNDREAVLDEAKILNRVNGDGDLIGCEAPKKVCYWLNGGTSIGLLSPEYKGRDLYDAVFKKNILTEIDCVSLAWQGAKCLSDAHAKGITHGDVSLLNSFLDITESDVLHLRIGDWEKGVDHTLGYQEFIECGTPIYRFQADVDASKDACKRADAGALKKIAQAADCAAFCIVVFILHLREHPVKELPDDDSWIKDVTLLPNLPDLMKSMSYSDVTKKLLIQGVSEDYTKRPSLAKLEASMRADVHKLDPEKLAAFNISTLPSSVEVS